jgi:hypothetical protein
MNTLPPEFLTILDALGMSLAFWLALHLATHGWGWSRGRASQAAFAFAGMALVFGLAAWDDLHVVAGASSTSGWLRLLLLFFPVAWLGFARRLLPSALRNRTLIPALVISLLVLVPFAVMLQTVVLDPSQITLSWYFLPAYLIYALAALALTFYNTLDARNLVQSATERAVLYSYAFGSMAAMLGITIIAADLVFGLNHGVFPPQVQESAFVLRLIGTAFMLVATIMLWYLVHTQASADGALHLSVMRISLMVTLVLAAGAVAMVIYFTRDLPFTEQMVAIVLLFALTADWFIQTLRTQFERLFYRGESGTLRQTLHRVLDTLDPVYGPLPPAVRPLINNLSRQLNVPQLGLAMADEKDPKKYRIVLATNPKWEKSDLPVTSPDVWHERGHDGWNMPLRKEGRTMGMIASSGSRQLSRVQEKLLEEAGKEIIQLLEQWQQLSTRRQQLQTALDSYWKDEEAFERYSLSMVLDTGPRQDLRRQLTHLFAHFGEPTVYSNHPLSRLKLIETVAGSSTSATSRGETLRSVLINLIDQLRPAKTTPPENPTGEWVPYVVMHDIYIKGTPREEVMGRLHLTPDSVKKVEATAITQLAHLLSELEAAVMRREMREKREQEIRTAALRPALASKSKPSASPSPSYSSSSTSGYGTSSSTGYGTSATTGGFGGSSSGYSGAGNSGTTGGFGGTRPATAGNKPDDGKKSGGLLGGLGNVTSGLTQRFQRGDDKKGDPKPAAPTGTPAKTGGLGTLFNRNKVDQPGGGSKPTPKPVEGNSLKERFGGGLSNLGSGLTSKFNRSKGDESPPSPSSASSSSPSSSASPPFGGMGNRPPLSGSNAPTTVNPIFTRKPATPPPTGPGSMSSMGSGYVRPVPKPSSSSDPNSRKADPYGYNDDFDEDDLDDDEFNQFYNENT